MTQATLTLVETSGLETCLEVDRLSCRRGDRLLVSGFSLRVGSGEAVQIAGSNGRGKTTLLRVLCGLQRPARGQVRWNGVDIHGPDGHVGDLLYLAHENALNPDLTARENLLALGRLYHARPNATAALRALDMEAYAERLCGRLSAGQRRRVALARLALVAAPLWLLDEPAAALDAAGRRVLGTMIATHAATGGVVVFTTHEPLALPGLSARSICL